MQYHDTPKCGISEVYRIGFMTIGVLTTVKTVCNDDLYDKIYYLSFSVMGSNEDWKYQFTLANSVCLLELIWVAPGHLDEFQKAE